MNRIVCELIVSDDNDIDGGRSYGLMLYYADEKIQNNVNPLRFNCVKNISPSQEKVLRIKKIIEKQLLYPIHLRDFIEDYMDLI